MKMYKNMKLLIVFTLLSVMSLQAAELSKGMNAILDLGKQMSNMRNMLETYSLIATNVTYKDPDGRLQNSIAAYEGTLDSVGKTFADKEIADSIKASREAWKPVKTALLTALEDNDAKRIEEEALFIHGNIRSVIKELAKMKMFLLKKENVKHGDELNAAIEIAASSQRLSAHYMMKMWGLPDPTIQKHWDNGVKIYTDSIALLKKSEYYKDAAFKKSLDETEKHLKYFKMVVMFEDKFVPVLVHEKAQLAYDEANKLSTAILAQ
jgi:hypothetical protein